MSGRVLFLCNFPQSNSIELLNDALELFSDTPLETAQVELKSDVRNSLGNIYMMAGEWEKAVICFANNVLLNSRDFYDTEIPSSAKISVEEMPFSRSKIVNFFADIPEIIIDDDLFSETIAVIKQGYSIFNPAFDDIDAEQQNAWDKYVVAEAYAFYFQTIMPREGNEMNSAIAFANLANVIVKQLDEPTEFSTDFSLYAERAKNILSTITPTEANRYEYAISLATAARARFATGLSFLNSQFIDDYDLSDIHEALELYIEAYSEMDAVIQNAPDNKIYQHQIADMNYIMGMYMQEIPDDFSLFNALIFLGRAYLISKDKGLDDKTIDGYNFAYRQLYKKLYPFKYILGGSRLFLKDINMDVSAST